MSDVNTIEGEIRVRAVIEVSVDTTQLPPLSRGRQLALAVMDQATMSSLAKTADGWFVPLEFLLSRIGDVADFLHFETLQYGEFEISGGLEVFSANRRLLGVPSGATFRSARNLVDVIVRGESEGRERQIFLSSQHMWRVRWEKEAVNIQPQEISSRRMFQPIGISAIGLQQRMQHSWDEVVVFAGELQPLMLNDIDMRLTPKEFRSMFGLVDD